MKYLYIWVATFAVFALLIFGVVGGINRMSYDYFLSQDVLLLIYLSTSSIMATLITCTAYLKDLIEKLQKL